MVHIREIALAACVLAGLTAWAVEPASTPSAPYPFEGRMALTAPLMLSRTPEPSKVTDCQVHKGTRVQVLSKSQSALKVEEQQFNIIVLDGPCRGMKGFTPVENIAAPR